MMQQHLKKRTTFHHKQFLKKTTMRKLFLFLLFSASATFLFAQDMKDIQGDIDKKKYTEAKAKVDKAIADAKNAKNADVYYYKGIVYNELAKDSTNKENTAALRQEAYNAFKKYLELDPKNIRGTLQQNWWFFDLYNENIKTALTQHNNKDYANAVKNYKNAFDVHDFILKNKFQYNNQSLPVLDTTYLYYAGSAALEAKDTALAIQYFDQLANANIGGKDYLFVYQTLVNYYNAKGDKANLDRAVGLGKKLYPDNQYWLYYELQDPSYKTDKKKMLAKYEEILAKNPDNADLKEDYTLELYNFAYTDENNAKDSALHSRAKTALTELINAKPSAFYNYLMLQALQYEAGVMYEDINKIKGTKPEDVKRKTTLAAAAKQKDTEAMKYAVVAADLYGKQDKLKSQESAYYKDVLNRLASYYRSQKQMDKAAQYEAKLKQL
jgi:hypothetical protein